MYTNVEQVFFYNNGKVKYLPKNFGEKFPNLKDFWTKSCGLVIIRNFYFLNMRNLEYLVLSFNKIASIDSKAFKDLVNVKRLWLRSNLLQTLDRNLLDPMVKLELIDIVGNKISQLCSDTFFIPGGKLELVDLRTNVCIDKIWGSKAWGHDNMKQLQNDLAASC